MKVKNVLVDYRVTINVPADRLERNVGRPDDETDDWYQEACDKAEQWARENPEALEDATDEPEVEAC